MSETGYDVSTSVRILTVLVIDYY